MGAVDRRPASPPVRRALLRAWSAHAREVANARDGVEHLAADLHTDAADRADALLDLIARHRAALAELDIVRTAARELCKDLDLAVLDLPGLALLLDDDPDLDGED